VGEEMMNESVFSWGQEQYKGNTMMLNNQIKIKVDKRKLLSTLKENLEKHKKQYTESVEAWKKKAAEEVAKLPERILKGEVKHIRNVISEYDDRPTSYAPSYEAVIRMLEYCADEVIELESTDFERYVADNWEWKQSFVANSAKYGSSI
jgi:uncharacterized protein YbcC (UPF0753/DUF2309 family)